MQLGFASLKDSYFYVANNVAIMFENKFNSILKNGKKKDRKSVV